MRAEKRLRIAFVLGMAGLLIGSIFFARASIRRIAEQVRKDLSFGVGVAGAALGPGHIAQLAVSPEDKQTEAYVRLRSMLSRLQNTLAAASIRGIYLMKVRGDQAWFIADSAPEDDPWHSEPGDAYQEPPPEVFEVQRQGGARFVGPYTDEYGTFYSVFSSVVDPEGRVIAVVGGDIEASMYDRLMSERLRSVVVGVMFLFALYLVLALVIAEVLRKRQEEARRQAERLHAAKERDALLMNLNEGVVAVDGDGRVSYVNAYATRAIGATPGALVGKPCADSWLVTDEKGEALPEDRQPILLAKKGVKAQRAGYVYLRGKDGPIPVIVATATVRGKDMPEMTVMTFRDFTKEAEIDRMKTDFISVATHQIKTPLTALKWIVGTLAESASPRSAEDKDALGQLEEVVAHLDDLVKALLNVSRAESGRLVVAPRATSIATLAKDVIKESSFRAKEKDIAVTLAVGDDVPDVIADPQLIREVFKNLVTNAVKYTPKGGHVTVRIVLDGKNVLSAVEDDGYGIPAKERDRVFERFYRGKNIVGLDEDGTGLGLYFAKQVVEASGGKLWFESTEGKGSTFYFSLPLVGGKPRKGSPRAD